MNDQDWQARALEVAQAAYRSDNWDVDAKRILTFAREYAAEALAEVGRLEQERADLWNKERETSGILISVKAANADLRAQLAAATGPGWQPIETAPKDGTGFIGWDDDLEHRVFVRWVHGRWALVDQEHFSPCRLTLWAALPAPPKEGT